MVPPTGATDSILVVRRNGVLTESYYGAPTTQLKNHQMENNDKKKQWCDRWKMGKSGKVPLENQSAETPGFVVHPDYVHKYGTLSNGVLTKSFQCGETWLYGTVGVRAAPPHRPSLFLYPGVVTPTPRIVTQNGPTGFPSSPPAFVPVPIKFENRIGNGTLRLHRPRSVNCQCGDIRRDSKKSDLTERQCRKCGAKMKSGTLRSGHSYRTNLSEVSGPHDKTNVSDPYNMMRKNRMSVGETTETFVFNSDKTRKRTKSKSVSPMRRKSRDSPSPSFETFKPKQSEDCSKNWKADEEGWYSEDAEDQKIKRKSILECNLNAYELNRKNSRDSDDSGEELEDAVPVETAASDACLRITRPKLTNKTEIKCRKSKSADADKLAGFTEVTQKTEVRVSGQRFKIFDHSNTSTEALEEYVSDDQAGGNRKVAIPRLTSPKRPPRRCKVQSTEESFFKYSKSKSKSSPNLSIKSILKKPIGNEDGSDPDSPDASDCMERSSPEQTRREKSLNSVQSSGKSNRGTFKKKKQVQFKVNVSNEPLGEIRQRSEESENSRGTEENDETVQRSQSCEDLLLANETEIERPIGNEVDGVKIEIIHQKEPNETSSAKADDDSDSDAQYPLKRSYSDRRPSSMLTLTKNDDTNDSKISSNASLFHDTMALRTRTTRLDTREVFIDENELTEDQIDRKTIQPSRSTKENKFGDKSNLITYAEFAMLTDQKEISADKSYLRRMRCKSLDHSVSLMNTSAAPSPPPRQVHPKSRKLSSPGATSIKLQVPSFDDSNNKISILESRKMDSEKSAETVGKSTKNKTIVTLSSENDGKKRRPSITINSRNAPEEYLKENFGKTSVMINNYRKEDSNKVTISVRNEAPHMEEPNSSTCTIIETGSNSTVIPVVSMDNKTTLIVGNSNAISVTEEKSDKPSQYIFSNINAVGEDNARAIESLDPVEAIRRNLIPHICGKEDSGQTLMEKIKQSRELKEQKNPKQISESITKQSKLEELTDESSESLLTAYQTKKNLTNWKNTSNKTFKIEEDVTSLSDGSAKNSSASTSRSNSFRSSCYKSPESDYETNLFLPLSIARRKFCILSDNEDASTQERDKLEDEYEILNGLKKENSENIYETIKEEPIYDQIGKKAEESDEDTPPPLPLTLPPSLDEIEKRSPKSIFEGATKYDILSYLVDAKDRVQEDTYFSGSSTSDEIENRRLSLVEEGGKTSFDSGMHRRGASDGVEREESLKREETSCKEDAPLENDSVADLSSRISQISQASDSSDENMILSTAKEREALKLNRKSSAEIERNDSGVGSETSQTSRSKWQASSIIREDPQHSCEDCDQAVETQVTDSGVMYAPLVCRKCSKRRSERKEIIQEIAETEDKYGRDLRIILEEFYRPMLVAGLLTPDQLSAIFLNTEELLENNEQLSEKLRDTLEIAMEQGDEDLLTVNIGKLFLEAGPMLHAFESYCTRQATAAVLLANLEKEKELLRIFLRVSQMENTVLRRMNLNSFLMVPVQRVTKYPLLLARLYKVTPPHHESRELLKEAQHNIELHLEHMNSVAKDLSAIKVWRRFSASTASGRKSTSELEMVNIKLRKMAIDILEWNHEEVRFVLEGKLLYTQPTDNNWKRGRTIKLSPVFVLLVTLGKPNSKYKPDPTDEELTFPKKTGVREATLLLVKEKCGRYSLIREPLFLDKIIVCCETDADEYFEIQELSTKDTIIFKAEDGERTKEWYRQLQYHAQILGSWRRRRNALANIMINGMMARTYTA